MSDLRVYLVGCGKSKLDRPARVRDLYTGPLFRRSLAYAEHASRCDPDPWAEVYVLSALHGLCELDRIVPPYDLTLNDQTRAGRHAWAQRVVNELLRAGWDFERTEFVFLAGSAYVAPLVGWMPRWSAPVAHLGIGQGLAWLNEHTPGWTSSGSTGSGSAGGEA